MNISVEKQLPEGDILCFIPYKSDETLLKKVLSSLSVFHTDTLRFLSRSSTKEFTIPSEGRLFLFIKIEGESFGPLMRKFRKVARSYREYPVKHWALYALHIESPDECEQLSRAFIHGCITSTQNPGKNKTTTDFDHSLCEEGASLTIISHFEDHLRTKINSFQSVAKAHLNAMILGNSPSNKKDVNYMAAYCKVLAEKYSLEIELFDHERLELEGFKALLAVNRGSETPAKMVILKYNLSATHLPLVGLIGKGVLFDTGGINLKPSENLFLMKSDMCGAAAVLGAIEAIAATKCNARVVVAIPLTDNAIDAKSTKPGDVIGSYNGKTIEVIDTDAEGRLCLADAISYICRTYRPDYLIDVATLTGSAARALGIHYAALFSTSDQLTDMLRNVGNTIGEKLWPMPMDPDYKEDLHSDVADLANFSNKPTAGAISAALFLQEFVENTPHWAHIDIAGTAFTSSEFGKQRTATGFGALLLYSFVHALESSH